MKRVTAGAPHFHAVAAGICTALALLCPPPAGAATEVNTCGQVFSGEGFLSGDLVCPSTAVTIQGGGSLDLQGFTLTVNASPLVAAVLCEGGACEVLSIPSGGRIAGGGVVSSSAKGQPVTLRDVVITGNGALLCVFGEPLRVFGSEIRDCLFGAMAARRLELVDSTIANCSEAALDGLLGTLGSVKKVRAIIVRSTISGNGAVMRHAVQGSVVIEDSVIANNDEGVVAFGPIRVDRSVVTGNGRVGVEAEKRRLRVRDSVISSNGLSGAFPVGGLVGARESARVLVRNSQLIGNLVGVKARRSISIQDSEIRDSVADGVIAPRITLRNATVSGNGGAGVVSRPINFPPLTPVIRSKARIIDSSITQNGTFGVLGAGVAGTAQDCTSAGSVTVRGANVTGNGTGAPCGVSEPCADIAACELPRLRSTTCDTSYVTASGFPGSTWSACALD